MGVVEVKNSRTGQTVADVNAGVQPMTEVGVGVPSELQVDLESQARLAEIMSDSPRMVNLAGTEWEIHALRMGTQMRIAKIIADMELKDGATAGDVFKAFAVNIPAVMEVLTLALLNDRQKLFKDGNPLNGYSDLFYATKDTLEWEGNKAEYSVLLLEVFQMLDVSFFTDDVLGTLQIFRTSITEKKRERKKKTSGQK